MAPRKKVVPQPEASPVLKAARSKTDNPLVFISHDSRDADLAEAFGNLLTDASGGILKSFRSSDRKGAAGIEYGQEWYRAIMQKLDDATDVVALLTAHSVNRPWILYEAGVAKGKLTTSDSVLGIALGVSLDEAATGPFAQFQNSPDEEDAITGLVLQLIRRHPQAAPREEAVRRQVQAFRESVANILKTRGKEHHHHAARVDETSVAKFFEEIKVLVRDMPERVALELGDVAGTPQARKKRRIHPAFLEHLLHHPMFKESSGLTGLPILMMFSTVRDEYPWLYELGMKLHHAFEAGNLGEIERSRKIIMEVLDFTVHSPFGELGADHETVMELRHFIKHFERRLRIPRRSIGVEIKSSKPV